MLQLDMEDEANVLVCRRDLGCRWEICALKNTEVAESSALGRRWTHGAW